MTRFEKIICILCVSFLYIASHAETAAQSTTNGRKEDPVAVLPPKDKIPENLLLVGNGNLHPKHIFIADKSKRTLTVWNINEKDFSLHGAYPMDIGKNSGDKLSSGDQKTPEGLYFFEERKEGAGLDFNEYGIRAFTLDYPNYFDKRFGKTGNGIWLHAIPETKSLLRGSRGCVVVRNEIIETLTPLINVQKTPMIITDAVNYVTLDSQSKMQKEILAWIEDWRVSWQTRNIDNYISHYAEDFKAQKMNRTQWREYKNSLNKKYTLIDVEIKNPMVIGEKGNFVIQARQTYKSDRINDTGEKILYVRKNDANKYEIVTELWRPIRREMLANSPTTDY